MSSGQSVPAGWYVDQTGAQRWWDGAQWGMSAVEWTARFGPAQDHAASPASAVPAHDPQGAASPQAEGERKRAEHALKEQEQTEHREQVAHEKEADRERKRAEHALRKQEHEQHREQAAHAKDVAKRHPEWQRKMDIAEDALHTIETATPTAGGDIVLKRGELFYQDFACELIADRTQREFVGGSKGISVPIGSIGGHAIRYRVGAFQGHSTTQTVETVVDTGRVAVTTQRIIFHGSSQTREHLFANLISYEPMDVRNLLISVSNRQTATHLRLMPADAGDLVIAIEIAVAEFRGERDKLIADARQQVDQMRAAEPK